MKTISLFLAAMFFSSFAGATTLNCQLKYTWPKGSDDLNYDLDQKVSVKLKVIKDVPMLAADADLVTLDGRFEIHMTAMAPPPGEKGSAFIRLGAMDKQADTYFSGDEVFVLAGKNPYNRAHLHVGPDFKKDENKPAHGLGIDCTLD